MSLAEEVIAAEALGRIVAPIPSTSVFAAAHVLASSMTPQATSLGQALAAGEIVVGAGLSAADRSEEHTSELQSIMRISYAVFCLKKKNSHSNTSHKQKHHIYT